MNPVQDMVNSAQNVTTTSNGSNSLNTDSSAATMNAKPERITIVTPGKFDESVHITTANGITVLESAPGVTNKQNTIATSTESSQETNLVPENNARNLRRIVEVPRRSGSENQLGENVQVSRLSSPLIAEEDNTPVLKQFFSSIQDGQVKAPQGFQAGDLISMIVEGTHEASNSEVSMTLISSDSGETVQVSGTLSENVGAGIEGNRQVGEFQLPYDLTKGFYDVFLNISDVSSSVSQIEISDYVSQNRRRELVQIINASMKHLYEFPYTMIGPYSPLPSGAQIQDSDTGEIVSVIDEDNMWLFFGYDPTSFFPQSDAKWILINSNSEQMQIFENREFWPNVLLANGEPYPFQYGNRNHFLLQAFTTGDGVYFQDGNTDSGRKGPVVPQLATNTGRSIIGVPMKEGCDPKKVKKYAIFVTFNDIEKQFKQLLDEEKDLVKKLGFDGTKELSPKDFLPDREKGLGANKVSLDALKQAILDILKKEEKNKCCLEIVLFINAHQNSENAVKIQHRFTYEKNKKTRSKTVNAHINNGKLVEFISQVLKDAKRTCIPTAIVFHSCNSGKFDSSAFDNAFKGNPNLRVYASSSAKQKTSGKLSGDEFFFIEGLKILLTAPKTFRGTLGRNSRTKLKKDLARPSSGVVF